MGTPTLNRVVKEYSFRDGVGVHFPVKASTAGKYLEQVEQKHGKVTPETLLDEVENDASTPLRKCFEWKDGEAAHKYRLMQAGLLIRAIQVRVTVEEKPMNAEPMRAFVNIKPSKTAARIYRNTVDVMSDAALRAQVIQKALDELQTWENRYRQYRELGAIISSVQRGREMLLKKLAKSVKVSGPKAKTAVA